MGLVPARRPGWLLEGRGNPSPRGMAAQSRHEARWTEPGLQALWRYFTDSAGRFSAAGAVNRPKLWLGRNDRTTGDSRAGGPMETRDGTQRRSACAIARVAPTSVIVRLRRRPTSPSDGISASPTRPNTTGIGIILRASARRMPHVARQRRRAVHRLSASLRTGPGLALATAPVAATRCARWTLSNSTATRTSLP